MDEVGLSALTDIWRARLPRRASQLSRPAAERMGLVAVLGSKSMSASVPSEVEVRYRVSGFSERWTIPEGAVPEARWHYEGAQAFGERVSFGLERAGRRAAVCRNLAIRVRRDRPNVGFDPDVCVIEPPPPDEARLDSLKLWAAGHAPPRLVVEFVSRQHPTKDVPDICAAIGVEELVVFDPTRSGPTSRGGGALLQIWRRAPDGSFERAFAGDTNAPSSVLGAWLIPKRETRELVVADDPEGAALWLTREEQAAAERAAREVERAAKEAALARVAELEAELARKR